MLSCQLPSWRQGWLTGSATRQCRRRSRPGRLDDAALGRGICRVGGASLPPCCALSRDALGDLFLELFRALATQQCSPWSAAAILMGRPTATGEIRVHARAATPRMAPLFFAGCCARTPLAVGAPSPQRAVRHHDRRPAAWRRHRCDLVPPGRDGVGQAGLRVEDRGRRPAGLRRPQQAATRRNTPAHSYAVRTAVQSTITFISIYMSIYIYMLSKHHYIYIYIDVYIHLYVIYIYIYIYIYI